MEPGKRSNPDCLTANDAYLRQTAEGVEHVWMLPYGAKIHQGTTKVQAFSALMTKRYGQVNEHYPRER